MCVLNARSQQNNVTGNSAAAIAGSRNTVSGVFAVDVTGCAEWVVCFRCRVGVGAEWRIHACMLGARSQQNNVSGNSAAAVGGLQNTVSGGGAVEVAGCAENVARFVVVLSSVLRGVCVRARVCVCLCVCVCVGCVLDARSQRNTVSGFTAVAIAGFNNTASGSFAVDVAGCAIGLRALCSRRC